MDLRLIRVLLSSPGDLSVERSLVKEVCDEINLDNGRRNHFHVEVIDWKTHAFSARGSDGQNVLNVQFPDDYEIYLGMLASRFGTPTPRWGSGTEEEFRAAIERNNRTGLPSVMFYFGSSPIDPASADLDELRRIRSFRKDVEKLGVLHFPFDDPSSLKVLLHRHVSATIFEVLGTKNSREFELYGSPDAASFLPFTTELFDAAPLIYANELVHLSTAKIGKFADILKSQATALNSLTRSFTRETRNITRAASNNREDRILIFINNVVDEIGNWQRKLRVDLPNMHSYHSEMTTLLQRAFNVVEQSNDLDKMPFEIATETVTGLLSSFRDLVVQIAPMTDAIDALDHGGHLDLSLQAQLMRSAMKDYEYFVETAIDLSQDLVQNLIPK